ncbi:MAG: LuxR C-terminal-related transcriptional regulator [Flavobacteriaceae bacterium]|nr:LuxR C-terminal-related transcriptional regulator [Flavobacteriaceae bacterium]
MNIINQYDELIKTDYKLTDELMTVHLERFQLLNDVLPPSSSFFMITNTNKDNYELISNNLEYATGLSKAALMENGISYFLSLIHPKEIENYMQIIKEFMEFYLLNYKVEDLKKLEFQYNYRIKGSNGKYLNILENQVNLLTDDKGKPNIDLRHFTVFGEGKPKPMEAVVRYLNDQNEYKTVFRKIYGCELLENGISIRELEILKLLILGLTSKQIANKLSISEHTVKTHRKNMIAKCKVKNIIELCVQYIKEGII